MVRPVPALRASDNPTNARGFISRYERHHSGDLVDAAHDFRGQRASLDRGDIDLDLSAASYSGDLPQDAIPATISQLVGSASPLYLATDDFNGRQRGGAADVGAYLWQADGNPGWTLAAEFKALLLIFLEGFESGDLSQWSGSLP